jgi:membrane-bound lytic murein transglycosylase D
MIATFTRGLSRAAVVLLSIATLLLAAGCQTMTGSDDGPDGKPETGATKPAATKPAGVRVRPDGAGPEPDEDPPAADLWPLIRAAYALDHELDHPAVQAEIAALRRYPAHFAKMQDRLQLYLPHIAQQILERGMPGELALLPIIESGMNPNAQSLSGAAGLWQFIPATADRFGMPRNWWYDGRRDHVRSTEAALDYLQYLHRQFGDWRLAVVAYNAGEGTVTRALTGKPSDTPFWALRLSPAATAFVPKLLALAEVIANPEAYGIALPDVDADPGFITLETPGQLEIAKVADALGMDEEVLYQLNPGLNRTVTPPEGPHELHVPTATADQASAWIANLDDADRVAWDRIQIYKGDSLSLIASRYRTNVRTLREINNLTDDRLRIGQILFVPRTPAISDSDPRPAVVAGAATSSPRSNTHVVRAGETLWEIARSYRVPLDELLRANQLTTGQVLRIGQRLVVPVRAASR